MPRASRSSGHHEILIPLLHAAVLARFARAAPSRPTPSRMIRSRKTATINENCRVLPQSGRRHGDGDTDLSFDSTGIPAGVDRGCDQVSRRAHARRDTWFDELISLDPTSGDRAERTAPVLRQLRHARFDVAVLFPNSIRSAWIAWLAGIPRRIGYVRDGAGCCCLTGLHYRATNRDGGFRRRSWNRTSTWRVDSAVRSTLLGSSLPPPTTTRRLPITPGRHWVCDPANASCA